MAERSEVKLESQQGIESLVGRDQRKRGEGERERRSSGGSHESVLNGKQAKAQSQKMGSEST